MRPGFRFLLVAGFALSSCVSTRELAVGNYQETRGPGVMMWTMEHLRILPGQAFQYDLNTDDDSGRNGAGTYTLRGKKLRLLFNGKALVPASYAQRRPLPTRPDSLLLTFEVYDAANGNEPLPFAGILLYDEAGHVEKGIASDVHGQAVVRTARSQHPRSFSVRYLGRQVIMQPCPDSSTAYKLFMQPSLGTLYPAGSRLQFRVLHQTPAQLVVRQGKSNVTFLFTP